MITTYEEYYTNLTNIKNVNPTNTALLIPKDEPIYKIDLNTRKV